MHYFHIATHSKPLRLLREKPPETNTHLTKWRNIEMLVLTIIFWIKSYCSSISDNYLYTHAIQKTSSFLLWICIKVCPCSQFMLFFSPTLLLLSRDNSSAGCILILHTKAVETQTFLHQSNWGWGFFFLFYEHIAIQTLNCAAKSPILPASLIILMWYKAARLNELNTLWQGKTLMAYTRKYHIHTHINLQLKIWHSHTHKGPWM